MIGRIIGDRYRVEQQLSKKAGRQTFLAIDLSTWEQVVIKRLMFDTDFQWDDLKLFEREVETLQSLSHPSIPRYLNHFELDKPNGKGFVLVQSYVQGRSLEDYLQAGRTFDEAQIRELAHALLNILIYLHRQKPPVVHRDIKPSNILLTNGSNTTIGQVYLVDFGSVQTLAAREGGTLTIVGTYGYMPPEQFGGRATPPSDLYSLGTTLIRLITGKHPADLPQKQLRLQFEPLVQLSPELKKWLARMVEPGLSERFASAQEALRVLLYPPTLAHATTTTNPPLQPAIPRPKDSKALVLKQQGWIDVLVPQSITPADSNQQPAYARLYIDHYQITYTSFHGQEQPPSLRVAIVGLECCTGVTTSDCKLNIVTTRLTYTLGGDGSLTADELKWIASELSHWLGLPVIHT